MAEELQVEGPHRGTEEKSSKNPKQSSSKNVGDETAVASTSGQNGLILNSIC